MNNSKIVNLKGNLSPLEEYFRQFDIGKAHWTTADYINYATQKISPHFLKDALIEDAKQRHKEKNNEVIYIYGTQGCQPAGSKVLLSNGTAKNIEDIKVGDEVISLQYNGNTTFEKVVTTTNWFCDEMYSVISKRNNELLYKCSNNHLIPLTLDFANFEKGKTHKTRQKYFRQLNVLATPPEIMQWQKNEKVCRWQTKQGLYIENFKVNKNCDIEPYSLGVWLGDGHFSQSGELGITSNNKEIIDCVNTFYPYSRIRNKTGTTCKTYYYHRNEPFCKLLEQEGLKGKKSGTKFIPKSALLSDAKYRMKLLAGLIDTDGFVDKRGQINITTKSKQLAEDIKFLVCSLGGNSSIRKIHKKCQVKNFVGTYYTITVTLGAYKHLLNLNVEFKRKRLFIKNSWQKQGIINFKIERTESCQVYGFEITGESKLYVTDNMLITHNSGKSLLAICLGLELGKIYGRPLKVTNIGFFDSQFLDIIKKGETLDTFIHDEEDNKNYGALSTYFSGELLDAMFRNRALQQNYIFTSPHEGERGQFITIDVKNTRKVNGKPSQIEALLYTSWYNDSSIRVCRGILVWDVPQEALDFYDNYIKFKMDSLDKIKKDLGGNFDIVERVAKEKYEELKPQLILEEKGKYVMPKGAYFGDIIEVKGKIGKYTADIRKKIIRAVKVMAQQEIDKLNGVN